MTATGLKSRDNGVSDIGSNAVYYGPGFTAPCFDEPQGRVVAFTGSLLFSSPQTDRRHRRRRSGSKNARPMACDASAQQRRFRTVAHLVPDAASCSPTYRVRDYALASQSLAVEEPAVPRVERCPPRKAEIKKKLRVQIMSDLHVDSLRARGFPPIAPDAGLVVIAGDTCEGARQAVRLMRSAYPATDIVAVAGNHEFYRTTYSEELDAAREYARMLGIHLLENQTVTFGRLRVIGATLWTDYSLFGESLRVPAMRLASETMRDHSRIKWERYPWKRFRPQEARALHLRSRAYIESEFAKPHDGPTLVLTHHPAIVEALAPQLRGRMIAAAYASDLSSMIDRYQPEYWISGHTHYPIDHHRGRTRLISNPCGYHNELSSFDPALVIEVEA